MSEWDDTLPSSNKAQNLRRSISQLEFIITLLITLKVFTFGLPLSKQFQNTNNDLKMTTNLAQDTLENWIVNFMKFL